MRLIIIGEGPLLNKIEKRNLKNVKTIGYVSKKLLYSYMKKAKFTIIPSLIYEQGPLVLLESYANDTPVIVPKFASFKEKVEDNKTGLFYKAFDFKDLKNKIVKANEIKSTDYMKKNIKLEFESKYSAAKYYSSIINVYRKLL